MKDIPQYKNFAIIKPILKGYSTDKKYYIETISGEKLLLRISSISEFEKKKAEYEKVEKVAALNIICSKPVAFGVCDDGKSVFILLTWIEGEDLADRLKQISEKEQYSLGLKAGEILRKIHTLPTPNDYPLWHDRFNRKIEIRNKKLQECKIKSRHEKSILDFIDSNKQLLFNRPQCFRHGDFHASNLVLTSDNEIGVIDFNRSDYGDPYEEYDRIIFDVSISPEFARGRIDGYFSKKIPADFFPLTAFYIAGGALSAIIWATQFDEKGIDMHLKNVDLVMEWYDNLSTTIPSWYKNRTSD